MKYHLLLLHRLALRVGLITTLFLFCARESVAQYSYAVCGQYNTIVDDEVMVTFRVAPLDASVDYQPGGYMTKLLVDGTEGRSVSFTINPDRSVTGVDLDGYGVNYIPFGAGFNTFSHSVKTDGNLYQYGNVVGRASGAVSFTWSKVPCPYAVTVFEYYLTITIEPPRCGQTTPAASANVSLGSVDFEVGLGTGTNYQGEALLNIKAETAIPFLASPTNLLVQSSGPVAAVRTNGILRQVLSGQFLADIGTNSPHKYNILLYAATDVGVFTNGLYQVTNSPHKTYIVENPDGSTNYNRLWIASIEGTITNLWKYTFTTNTSGNDYTWQLEYPENFKKEVLRTTWSAGLSNKTSVLSVYQPGSPDVLVYQRTERYQDYGWGAVLVEQVLGTNGVRLTNSWQYYTNSAQTGSYRNLKQKIEWSGYWETYSYDYYERQTNRTSGFLNATNGSSPSECRVISTSYSSTAPNITQIEQLGGVEVSRSYKAFYSTTNTIQTVQCQTPSATWSDASNLVTKTKRNDYNQPLIVWHPDGTRTFYSYVTNTSNYSVTTTTTTGQTNGAGTAILEGAKSITVVGPYGEMVSNIVVNISGGTDGIILARDSYTYAADDYARRYPTVTHLDGTTTSGTSGCCGSPNTGNTVDKDGTTTYYVEDALKRRVSATVNNITSSNIFDAYGNSLVTLRLGTDASVITNRIAAYDTAGQLIAETNALNSPTLYTNWIDGSGQLVKQTTSADGGTRIETYYRDGQLQSVTGTAVAPVRYAYGVVSDGGVQRAYSAEIKLDAAFADTSERTTNFVDMVGRTYKTAYAAASGTPFVISYYNTKGQLTNQVDADGVSTLYAYNPKGELAYTVVDVDRDYTIDWSGEDRISYMVNDALNNGTADVRRSRTYVWNTSANSSNLVSTVEASVDGLRSWNTIWNNGTAITSQSRTVYDAANGYRYVTNIAPDNSYSVAITRYGTNVSQTAFDSTGTQLAQATFAYDAHGRQSTVTDARIGATTFTFNNADQVVTTTTPVPASGQSAQVTTNYFDNMGRVWKTTLPDNTSVTNKYDVTGLLTNTFGSRTYPVAYTYDAQGRMKTMKTWQNFASGSGAATTTWNYDQYRGWLTNKTYDGGTAGPTYTYSAAGRLATRAWVRGTNTTYAYNNAGDLSTVYYSDGTAGVTNAYNRLGQTTGITNGSTVCVMDYNDAGLLLTERYTAGILSGIGVTNVYDHLLRRTNVSTLGVSTGYRYDNASRLAQVWSGTNSASYAYLANSPLVSQIAFTNGSALRMTTTKQYDLLNRLTSITNLPSAASALGFRYAYNNANQRTSVTNVESARWVYQYDSLGQVTSGKKYWSDGTPVAGQQFEYSFDDIGNRKTTASGGDQFGLNLRSAGYTNNALNQITGRSVPGYVDVQGSATNTATVTVNNQAIYRYGDYFRAELTAANSSPLWFGVTNVAVLNNGTNADIVSSVIGNVLVAKSPEAFAYDLDGNLTSDSLWTNSWNAENRLLTTESTASVPTAGRRKVEYSFDYYGRMIQRVASTNNGTTYVAYETNRFVYDGTAQLAELDGGNNLVKSYVRGLDLSGSLQGADGASGLLMISAGTNGTHYYCHDGNGNVMALVNATNGTSSADMDYTPFGQLLRATGPMALINTLGFSGQYRDNVTRHILYLYRGYNPDNGTWESQDSLEEQGGLNVFGFVANDPLNKVDLFGQQTFILPLITPMPPVSEYEMKTIGFKAWLKYKITAPHWQEVAKEWFYEKAKNHTFTGNSDPRNKDIANNIGFRKLLRCLLAKRRGAPTSNTDSWVIGYNDFEWRYRLFKSDAAGGEAAYTSATEFLGSYRVHVQDIGPMSGAKENIHRFEIHVSNMSDWTSGSRIPGRLGGGSIWSGHRQNDPRYKPNKSIGGDFPNDYIFEVDEDICAKCELP